MAIEFDPTKSDRNVRERGLAFSMVEDFDWDTAFVFEDTRTDYGEPRFIAIGDIANLFFVVVFTPRGENLRVISFRRASDKEIAVYEQARSVQD